MHEAAHAAPDLAKHLLDDLALLAAKLFRAGGSHVSARSRFGPLEVAALPDSLRGLIAAGCEVADLVARTRASADDRAESGAGDRELLGLRRASASCSDVPNPVGALAAKLFRVGGSRISVRSHFTPLVIAALPDTKRAYIATGCELADLVVWPKPLGPMVLIEARSDAEHAAVRGGG